MAPTHRTGVGGASLCAARTALGQGGRRGHFVRARGNRNSILHEPIDSPKLSVLPRTVEIDADQHLAAKTDDQDDVREADYPDA